MSLTLAVTGVLMLIAFGMGLGLEVDNFALLARRPRALVGGLLGQMVALPVIATGLALLVETEVIALGLLLLAVCPGGASSNYMTYLARGDVALSVSLTAINSVLSVLSVPFVFNAASTAVLGYAVDVRLPVAQTMGSTFLYTVVPVMAGMFLRRVSRGQAQRAAGPVAGVAFLALLALTPFLIAGRVPMLRPIALPVMLAVSALLALAMPAGYGVGALLGLPNGQRRALTVEVGVQNVALALFLALTFFEDPRLAAVPVGYLVSMYLFVPGFVGLCRMRDRSTGMV